jgi:WhiB family redox-sensing transcriptional regulator
MQWVAAAACSHADPDLFFSTQDPDEETYDLAKRVYCRGCPVRWDCLRFAVENKIDYGCWGGLSPRERNE